MSEVHTVAIVYPTAGKLARLTELLTQMGKDVHEKESGALRYILTTEVDSDNPSIVMIETYKDKEAADEHAKTEHFKNLFATFDEEGLMSKEPILVRTQSKAGFDIDRKLL